MLIATEVSTQQRNADAWLTLKTALEGNGIDYFAREEYDGALVVRCSDQRLWPYYLQIIRIGPGVGVALVRVEGKYGVPGNYRNYVNRVVAKVSRECVLGSIKFDMNSGAIVGETPILFIDGSLRPQDVLYALRRMSSLIEAVTWEMWQVINARKRMVQAQETLKERTRYLVAFEIDEED